MKKHRCKKERKSIKKTKNKLRFDIRLLINKFVEEEYYFQSYTDDATALESNDFTIRRSSRYMLYIHCDTGKFYPLLPH